MILPQVTFFRWALGAYLLYYYSLLLLDFQNYFGPQGMVWRQAIYPKFPSLLWYLDSMSAISIVFAVMVILIVALIAGRLNRAGVFILFSLQLSFHNANPLIIHEPQQLANLFLFSFLLLPLRNNQTGDPTIVQMLVVALGVYYLTAGLKKLPDVYWGQGEALRLLLEWPGLGRQQNGLVTWIVSSPLIASTLNYATLIFELSFLALSLTRWRPYLLIVGVVFHGFIKLTMDVGTFSEIMLVWYALLLDPEKFGAAVARIASCLNMWSQSVSTYTTGGNK